jgi:hypothetical protein
MNSLLFAGINMVLSAAFPRQSIPQFLLETVVLSNQKHHPVGWRSVKNTVASLALFRLKAFNASKFAQENLDR